MKKLITFCCILACASCRSDSSVEQLENIEKPCTIFAKYKAQNYESNVLIIRSSNGRLLKLTDDDELKALIDKYNVGDTIN